MLLYQVISSKNRRDFRTTAFNNLSTKTCHRGFFQHNLNVHRLDQSVLQNWEAKDQAEILIPGVCVDGEGRTSTKLFRTLCIDYAIY